MLHFDDAIGMKQSDIDHLVAFTKMTIPKYIEILFKQYSGGRFNNKRSYFYDGETNNGIKFNFWITLVETKESIIKYWNVRTYLEEYMEWFNLTSNDVEPKYLFPIFHVINGAVYIAVDGKHKENIFYADNGEEGILKLANTYTEFCNRLSLME